MFSSSSSDHSSYTWSQAAREGSLFVANSPLSFDSSPSPQAGKGHGHTYHIQGLDGRNIVVQGVKKRFNEALPHGSFGVIKSAVGPNGEDWVRKISWLNPPGDPLKNSGRVEASETAVKVHEKLRGKQGIVPYHGHEKYVNKAGKLKEVIFLDRADCDLKSRLEKIERDPLDQKTQLSLANQLLETLAVSLRGAAHGDLKPENILLKSSKDGLKLWLCDFDFYCESEGPWVKGTLNYLTPEVFFTGKCLNVRKLDVRAAGMILFYIFTNSFDASGKTSPYAFPWMSEKPIDRAAIERMGQAMRNFTPEKIRALLEEKVGDFQVQQLLFGMLQPDCKTRWTIDEAYAYFRMHVLSKLDGQTLVQTRARTRSLS